MLSSISWQEYWITVLLSSIFYYLVVYLTCFKGIFKSNSTVPKGKTFSFATTELKAEQSVSTMSSNEMQHSSKINTEELTAEACFDEINAFFENQKGSKPAKKEMIFSLYTILQKYPSLRNSDYTETINRVITTQAEAICSIHLSADELKGVWFG
jgi:hypothetical protein